MQERRAVLIERQHFIYPAHGTTVSIAPDTTPDSMHPTIRVEPKKCIHRGCCMHPSGSPRSGVRTPLRRDQTSLILHERPRSIEKFSDAPIPNDWNRRHVTDFSEHPETSATRCYLSISPDRSSTCELSETLPLLSPRTTTVLWDRHSRLRRSPDRACPSRRSAHRVPSRLRGEPHRRG